VFLLALVPVYALADHLTRVPKPILAGDAPPLEPLTGAERITTTRATHHGGVASARVRLPAAIGTQGASYDRAIAGPARVHAWIWVQGERAQKYVIVATQQRGRTRSAPLTFVGTGGWQRLGVTATLVRGDRIVYFNILRTRRGGTETFDVDDVGVLRLDR